MYALFYLLIIRAVTGAGPASAPETVPTSVEQSASVRLRQRLEQQKASSARINERFSHLQSKVRESSITLTPTILIERPKDEQESSAYVNVRVEVSESVNVLTDLPILNEEETVVSAEEHRETSSEPDSVLADIGGSIAADPTRVDHPVRNLKVIFCGNSGVGKSCIHDRMIGRAYNQDSQITLATEFASTTITVDGIDYKVRLQDTAGQERFRAVFHSFYTNTDGCIFVFDLTDRKSFQDILYWDNEYNLRADSTNAKILIGNKADLVDRRTVTRVEAEAVARGLGMVYFEYSAKVEVCELAPLRHLIRRMKDQPARVTPQSTLSLNKIVVKTPSKTGFNCC